MGYAQNLAKGTSHALGQAKMLEYERFAQAAAMQTEDHKEGVKAFLKKRAPRFK